MDHLCMVGDFNMIEDFSDRIGGSYALIGVVELITWEWLCLSFSLQDACHVTSFVRLEDSLSFSWLDRRQQGVNLSCLDKICIEIGIISSALFSNHAPMIIVVGKQPYHKK